MKLLYPLENFLGSGTKAKQKSDNKKFLIIHVEDYDEKSEK